MATNRRVQVNVKTMSTIAEEKRQTHSVFVSRVPYSWEEDDLWDPLSTFGKVSNVELKRDKHNDFRSKGCGVVTFVEATSAKKAMESGRLKLKQWKHDAVGTIKIYPLDDSVGETSVRICFAYRKGKCARGDECEFYHEEEFASAQCPTATSTSPKKYFFSSAK